MKKHLLTAAAAVLGLAGTAWAGALEEAAKHDPALAAAIKEAKEDGSYGHAYQASKDDVEAAAARLQAEGEIHLRKMGMSPDTARKASWAAQNKPGSACTRYVHQLLADYDSGADRGGYDEDLVVSIEHSGTCERKNLD
ncbi:hypothetical protein [Bombella intestini]|nr:hypothetical protein [Bombella intestini]